MGAWTVAGGGVDLIRTSWSPAEGNQSIDLNALSEGRIEQTMTVVPDQAYGLGFFYAANTDGGDPQNKSFHVEIQGAQVGPEFVFDAAGTTPQNMGWKSGEVRFTPTSSSITIAFDSDTVASASGPALDGVYLGAPGSGPLTVKNGGLAPNPRISLNQCATDKPISCATGDFWHTFNDLSVPGRGPALNLQRTYNAFEHGSDSMFGYGWSNSYGMSLATDVGGNVTIAQENGSEITFAPDGSGGFTAPTLVQASLVENTNGSFTLTDSHGGMTHTFAANGRLLAQEDRNGAATTFDYDAQNRLTTVTDAAGRTLTFGYDSNDRVVTATDPALREVSYSYDGSGNLVTATNVNGDLWEFTYDSAHQMLTMKDPRGNVVANNTYDSSGRVTAQKDALNRTTTLDYSGDPATTAGSTTTITDPRGKITKQDYAQFQMQSITRAFGTTQAATTTYTYHPATNNVASKTDPNDHTTSYTWDSRGNQTSSSNPLGRTTSTTWTALNEPATVTDPAGHTATFGYNTRGNRVTQSRPVNATTTQSQTFTYGDAAHPGDVTSITDPTGKTWTMLYNANGDLTKATNPLGGATSYGYDGTGRQTSMVSPRGNEAGASPAAFTTSYIYDQAGALTRSTDPLGHATNYAYDDDGNRTTVTDPLGHVTTTTFDAENQPTKVTRADGTALNYGYDPAGNQTTQTNANAKTTSYAYDSLGQVSSTHDPLNRATTYGYDPAGQLTSKTDPAGRETTFGYDVAGQRSTLSYSDGKTPNVTYTYTLNGQRATMIDGTGTTTYTYDWLGRLTGQTNGAAQATSYAYDLAGHLTALTYPNTKVVTRGYDNAGRLHTVTDWLGHTNTLTPDADSNPESVVSGNGVTATSSFDNAGQLSSTTHAAAGGATVASFGYTRNANGQLATSTPTGVTQSNESYPYTQLNQLAGVNTTTYTHDAADNLTKLVNGTTQTFDDANQLTAATNAGATTTHTNDTNGNRTTSTPPTGDKTNYAYDQAQRLTAVQKGKLYQPLTPARIADTRTGSGKPYAGQPLGPAGTLAVQVTGVGGVPATGVGAVVVNVTEASATASTFLTVFPTGVTRPPTSNINAITTGYASNQVTSAVGSNGQISIYNSTGTTNIVIDVLGYYSSSGAGMNAITPTRVADTRVGSGKPYAGQPIPPLGTLTVQISGTAGIPTGASTAILATTVLAPTKTGNLTAYPAGTTRPATSNMNFKVGTTLTKEITAGLGTSPSGAVTFYNPTTDPVDLLLDAVGYIHSIGDALTPLTPARIADTRTGSGQPNAGQTLTPGGTITVQATGVGGVPANARSVVVNLTSPANTTNGHLRVYPGGTLPATTSLSRELNTTTFNQVTTKLSATGTFTIYNSSGTTDVFVDVMGSYGPLASYTYNGDGLRATRSTTTAGQKFAWDPTGAVPLLLTDGATNYIYDDAGNPLQQIDAAGVVLYYQHDQYGSTRLLTNAAGAVAATFTYNAYGALTASTGTANTPLRWNGQYQDTDTGLYYLRARYYDPTTAQFLTRDPIVDLTEQPHSYANADPLNFSDPSGLWFGGADTALGAAIGGVVGTVFGAGSYLLKTAASNQDISAQGLAAASIGGLIGGAVGGACVGTTWVGWAACGAVGGAAGAFTTDLINTGHINGSHLAAGAAFGALGGTAGSKMFPLQGFKPYKLSNVWAPGPNSVRLYNRETTGAGIGLFAGFMPTC